MDLWDTLGDISRVAGDGALTACAERSGRERAAETVDRRIRAGNRRAVRDIHHGEDYSTKQCRVDTLWSLSKQGVSR